MALLHVLLEAGALAELWDLPPIAWWRPASEFPPGIGWFVLGHVDRSVSIIAVINPRSDREVFAAIAELFVYEVQAKLGLPGVPVRRILAAAVLGRDSRHLLAPCAACGVQFEPLGPLIEHRATLLAIGACHGQA